MRIEQLVTEFAPDEAEAIMREAGARHLAVVDQADHHPGLLSWVDLARAEARRRESKMREITAAEVGEVLAMICQPRAISRLAPEE